MNLKELDKMIEAVRDDKELLSFYLKKRKELVAKIKANVMNELKKIEIIPA